MSARLPASVCREPAAGLTVDGASAPSLFSGITEDLPFGGPAIADTPRRHAPVCGLHGTPGLPTGRDSGGQNGNVRTAARLTAELAVCSRPPVRRAGRSAPDRQRGSAASPKDTSTGLAAAVSATSKYGSGSQPLGRASW